MMTDNLKGIIMQSVLCIIWKTFKFKLDLQIERQLVCAMLFSYVSHNINNKYTQYYLETWD